MTMRDWIDQYADDCGVPLVLYDGFDSCIIGVGVQTSGMFVVYDQDKVLVTLEDEFEDETAALDWFEFNMACAWLGDHTPVFLVRPSEEEMQCITQRKTDACAKDAATPKSTSG